MYVLLPHVNTCTNILKIFQTGTLLAYDDRQILAARYVISYDYLCSMSQSGVYFIISPRAGWVPGFPQPSILSSQKSHLLKRES